MVVEVLRRKWRIILSDAKRRKFVLVVAGLLTAILIAVAGLVKSYQSRNVESERELIEE